MKRNLYYLLLSLLALPIVPVCAGEGGWHQDFEEQVPGDLPKGWSRAWGEQGDDQFLVSNLTAASGRHAMVLDRYTGSNLAQWGLQTSLPHFSEGFVLLSLAFRVEGSGSRAHLGMELRHGGKRDMAMAFRYSTFSLHTYMKDPPLGLGGGKVARYEQNSWYRLNFWLPTEKEGSTAYCRVDRLLPDGGEQACGPPLAFASTAAHTPKMLLMINLPPLRRGFRFYFDDLRCTAVNDHP